MNRIASTLQEVQDSLDAMARAGCRGFECSRQGLQVVNRWGAPMGVEAAETLERIRTDLGECRRCRLAAGRRHIVFGEGNPHARLMFVGEGPGYEEDKTGHPFVGAAGQLLTRIIGAMKLSRDQVYIANIIKCRPPGNRNPRPDEVAACWPFLHRQINAIQPQIICALGSFAARTLLKSDVPISRLRGRFHRFGSIRVMPTYHPAFLLRNAEKKRDVWEDIQQIMQALERHASKGQGPFGLGRGDQTTARRGSPTKRCKQRCQDL